MRIGILAYGENALPNGLLERLRSDDIDTIFAEPIGSLEMAKAEAERLGRADCDTVVVALGSGYAPRHLALSALFLPVPFLLLPAEHTDATPAEQWLRELRIFFATPSIPAPLSLELLAEEIRRWTQENERRERDRGIEWVRQLYGKRIRFVTETPPNPVLWMRQFGIFPVESDEPADTTWTAPTPADAVLLSLLKTLGGIDPIQYSPPTPAPNTESYTWASLVQQGDQFHCQCALSPAPLWYGVPGNHLGAIRAACEALDIPHFTP
jgi:hypothetical protein